jgi:hypothetical protein
MKTSNRFTIAPALGVLAFALFVICPTPGTRAARATGDDARRRMLNATPPVTLGDGQTFHVTYLNAGSNPFPARASASTRSPIRPPRTSVRTSDKLQFVERSETVKVTTN